MTVASNPHGAAVVHHSGAPLESARVAVVLLHGRGGTAQNMTRVASLLMERIDNPESIAFLMPQATANVWYPKSGFLPQTELQPWLDSALDMLDRIVEAVPTGTPIVLGGFSQGAMLSLEYASRGRKSLAGVIAWSGSLIGPVGEPHDEPIGVEDLRVFIGCGTDDDWIVVPAVESTAAMLSAAGADVDMRLYDGMDHRINDDEYGAAAALITDSQKD